MKKYIGLDIGGTKCAAVCGTLWEIFVIFGGNYMKTGALKKNCRTVSCGRLVRGRLAAL